MVDQKDNIEAQLESLMVEYERDEQRGARSSARWRETVRSSLGSTPRRRSIWLASLGMMLFWWFSHWNYTHQGAYLVRRHILPSHTTLGTGQRLRIMDKLDAHLVKHNPISGEWGGSIYERERVLTYEAVKRAKSCLHAEQLYSELWWPRRLLAYHPQDVRISDDGTCAEHLKIAILWSDYCHGGFMQSNRGEDVQCRSMVKSLDAMGYGVVTMTSHVKADLVYYHDLLEDLAKVVIAQPDNIRKLFQDPEAAWVEDGEAIETAHGESSLATHDSPIHPIPLHKLLVLDWWGVRENKTPVHPLGTEWYVTPFEIPGHTYIGFSIEDSCDPTLVIPPENRTRTALILAKKGEYFHNLAWKEDVWSAVANKADVQLDAYANEVGQWEIPKGITNRGGVSREEYSKRVAQAAVMIGVGMPGSSPSPYVALCQGTPFINPRRIGAPPVQDWYKSNNMFEWQQYQHGPLASYGPPFVYNVEQDDVDALVSAVNAAIENPIPSWIPDEMTEVANRDRIARVMERDWKGRAGRRADELGSTMTELARAERSRGVQAAAKG